MQIISIIIYISLSLAGYITAQASPGSNDLKLWLTISAQKRFLEVSWINAPAKKGDNILLTRQPPSKFKKMPLLRGIPLAAFEGGEGSGFVPLDGFTTSKTLPDPYEMDEGSGFGSGSGPEIREYWVSDNGPKDIVAAIKPSVSAQWFTTGVPFDYALEDVINIHTDCYGYWASYIDARGNILAGTCIRAYPRWMNELKERIANVRLRDLLLPATHDSGSYRPNFDPLLSENIVTKYALTQDDDIYSQLMHGVRYLDIRVGYYRGSKEKFFINHGITRHRPLSEVIQQVKDFVLETNEIVIFGLKEFPVGFGKGLEVHRNLVDFLFRGFGDLLVSPSIGWSGTLQDIWSRKQNVLLAYDENKIVQEYPNLLFNSVAQRWGNVDTWTGLERYLRDVNEYDISRISSRPVADMAELTPDTWGIISDEYGGLRKLADQVNWRLSKLYRDELGRRANIISLDFFRGTSLMEYAMEVNQRKSNL